MYVRRVHARAVTDKFYGGFSRGSYAFDVFSSFLLAKVYSVFSMKDVFFVVSHSN